jgi:ribosomal protein L40E
MAKNKTKICKHCGAEITKGAKVCPVCGGKNPKPIYKRVWFWLLVAVLLFILIPSKPEEAPKEEIEYTAVTVDQLYSDLEDNALKAEDTYQGAYVAVEGRMTVIDSDGEYIGLYPLNDEISLSGVHCRITSDDQKEAIKEHSKGDTIVVKGKITDIGEITGYSMNIDSIE